MAICVSTLMVLTACSANDQEPDQVEQPSPTEEAAPDDTPRDDLTEERPVEWDDAEVLSDNSIRVAFMAGNEACYGVRSVVEETDTEIQIGIVEGTIPDSPDACTMELREASLIVETQQPIADRDIVPR